MKKSIALLILICSIHLLQGQSNHVTLFKQAELSLAKKDYDEALVTGLQGLSLAENEKDGFYITRFLYLLGDAYLATREFESALIFYYRIVSNSLNENDKLNVANGYFFIGNVFYELGAFTLAKESYIQAYSDFESAGYGFGVKEVLYSLGLSYVKSGDHRKAVESFELMLEGKGDGELKIIYDRIFDNFSTSLFENKDYIKLKRYAQSYLELSSEADRISDIKLSLAKSFRMTNDFRTALKLSLEAHNADPMDLLKIEEVVSNYIILEEFEKATNLLNRSISNTKTPLNSGRLQYLLAKVATEDNRPQDAISHLRAAESTFGIHQDNVLIKQTLELFINSLELTGTDSEIDTYRSRLNAVESELSRALNLKKQRLLRADKDGQSMDLRVRSKIDEEYKQDLAARTKQLARSTEENRIELQETEKRLQQIELTRQRLEDERFEQDLLIAQQNLNAQLTQAQLDSLRKENELRRLRELESQRKLELAENEKMILDQQTKLQASQLQIVEQARFYLIIIVIAAASAIALLFTLIIRAKKSNKIISRQNEDLTKQKKKLSIAQIKLKKTLEEQVSAKNNLEVLHNELKNTQAQLIHAEKMSSLGQLTAGIAHEINNPATFVKGGIQALQHTVVGMLEHLKGIESMDIKLTDLKLKLNDIQRNIREDLPDFEDTCNQMILDVLFGTERIEEIVNGLRVFSRHDEAEIKTVNLHENLDSAILILESKLKEKAELVKSYDENVGRIECFPGQLNQVFMNLISNAVDAIEGYGKVWVETADLGDHIKISVKDDGSGIPKEIREKIFDPFFTTKDVGHGTGLGLSITYSIIQQHGGAISVQSEPGNGTTFTIVLDKFLSKSTLSKLSEEHLQKL